VNRLRRIVALEVASKALFCRLLDENGKREREDDNIVRGGRNHKGMGDGSKGVRRRERYLKDEKRG
jgi:hypothetical protein